MYQICDSAGTVCIRCDSAGTVCIRYVIVLELAVSDM